MGDEKYKEYKNVVNNMIRQKNALKAGIGLIESIPPTQRTVEQNKMLAGAREQLENFKNKSQTESSSKGQKEVLNKKREGNNYIDQDKVIAGMWEDAPNSSKNSKIDNVENSQLESVENDTENGIIEETVDNDTGIPGEYTDEIVWSIFKNLPVRKCGKGYYGKRIRQSDLRVDNYELKINPNNESFYLQQPDGRYVQFENMKNSTVQDAKLVKGARSYYHVEKLSPHMKQGLIKKVKRQLETENAAGYKLEWVVSDKIAVEQLTRFFAEQNMDIIVTYCPE